MFLNSLDRDFIVNFEFLDAENGLKYNLEMTVPSGTVIKPIKVETIAFIEKPELQIFKNATQLVYKIKLLSSDKNIKSGSNGVLELQSDVTDFYD
jgi:hypothetical protein